MTDPAPIPPTPGFPVFSGPLPPVNDAPPGDPAITRGPAPAGFGRPPASFDRPLTARPLAVDVADPQVALDWMRARLGMGEQPPGSNCNAITRSFGIGCVAWCCETISLAWNHAFGDVDLWQIDIQADYTKGVAYVPNLRVYGQRAGRYSSVPVIGSAGICVFESGEPIGDHVGLVESWVDTAGNQRVDTFDPAASDGTVVMLDGNFGNDLVRVRRSLTLLDGFVVPPFTTTTDQEDDMFTAADREALNAVRSVAEHLERWGDLAESGPHPGGLAHTDLMARLGAIEAKVDALTAAGEVPVGTVDVTGTLNLSPKQ